jgi:son of sevenless
VILAGIKKLMDNSFKEYRVRLKASKMPCIPYLGLWQTDLTFLSDGNPDRVEGGLINFKKMRKVADTILLVQQYQNDPYCFEPLEQVQEYLLNVPSIIEDEAYEKSLIIEPRAITATAQCDWMGE